LQPKNIFHSLLLGFIFAGIFSGGVYVYAIFTHPASYRAGGVGSESRYITKINQAFERTMKGDVKYRFVIDCTKF